MRDHMMGWAPLPALLSRLRGDEVYQKEAHPARASMPESVLNERWLLDAASMLTLTRLKERAGRRATKLNGHVLTSKEETQELAYGGIYATQVRGGLRTRLYRKWLGYWTRGHALFSAAVDEKEPCWMYHKLIEIDTSYGVAFVLEHDAVYLTSIEGSEDMAAGNPPLYRQYHAGFCGGWSPGYDCANDARETLWCRSLMPRIYPLHLVPEARIHGS